MLAQCFVRAYPVRVSKLILGNTTSPDAAYAARVAERQPRGLAVMPTWLIRSLVRRSLTRFLAPLPESKRAFWAAYMREMMADGIKERLEAMHTSILDFARMALTPHDLAAWPGTILILEAEDDQGFDAARRQALRTMYPQATVHTFRSGGHMMHITQRDAYITRVAAFLRA